MRAWLTTPRLAKFALILAVSLALGFSLNALHQRSFHQVAANSATAEPPVVATVEGKAISSKLYRMYLKNGIEALGLNDQTPAGRQQVDRLKEGVISELIERTLIEIEAERRGLTIPESKINEAYQKMITQLGGPAEYQAYLNAHGLSEAEFRATVSQSLAGELLQSELTKHLTIADSAVAEFYRQEQTNPKFADLFTEPARVAASHILVKARRPAITARLKAQGLSGSALEQQLATEMNQHRTRAALILSKARGGADFAQLAREYSEDPATQAKGGDLGLFTRHTHTAKFDEAAFALKPGQLSDIVETEYGYHIIKVAEHRPERMRRLDELVATIRDHLLARQRAAQLTAWLAERRRAARVEIDPFYRSGQTATKN